MVPGTIEEMIAYFNIWGLVKIVYLIALLVYVTFAFIVVRQIYLMTSTVVEEAMKLPLKTIGYLHLAFALVVFFLAIIIL